MDDWFGDQPTTLPVLTLTADLHREPHRAACSEQNSQPPPWLNAERGLSRLTVPVQPNKAAFEGPGGADGAVAPGGIDGQGPVTGRPCRRE